MSVFLVVDTAVAFAAAGEEETAGAFAGQVEAASPFLAVLLAVADEKLVAT